MKSFSTLFVLLSAVSATTITALPSLAQTTSVPITGGSISITNNFVGIPSLNSGGSVLTPVGPISISSLVLTTFNSQAGAVIQNGVPTASSSREDRVGDSVSASGTGSGTLSGNTLNNFNYAVTGTVSSVVFNPPVNPTSSQVTFALNGGNVSLPTALVSSLSGSTIPVSPSPSGSTGSSGSTGITQAVPITGGNFSATAPLSSNVTTFNSGSALTPLGPIVFSSISGVVTIPAIGFSSISTSPATRLPQSGDRVNSNGSASGSISGQNFANAPFFAFGSVLSFSSNATSGTVLGRIDSGEIQLPVSLVTSLSASNSSSISPILQNFFVGRGNQPFTESEIQRFREIFSSQPTPPQSNRANIAASAANDDSNGVISSLGKSRIGLGAW